MTSLRAGLLSFAVAVVSCGTDSEPAAEPKPGPFIGEPPPSTPRMQTIDDRRPTVDAATIDARRQALIHYLWGDQGFPSNLPRVERSIVPPVSGLGNLRRVDQLVVAMEGGESNVAHHYVAERSNGQLVVLALGHLCFFSDLKGIDPTNDDGYGQQRTLDALLREGYSVLATFMPHGNPTQCGDVKHDDLIAREVEHGHSLKWFFEPIAVSLNHLKTQSQAADFPRYARYSMLGMSGGGWTTTVYAAIDPTIRLSIPIAGSVPLHLRFGNSLGDAEQNLPAFYSLAGYPDLYVLGAAGGRRQVQILNRRDDCCFGEAKTGYDAEAHGPWDRAMRAVERGVQSTLASMGHTGGTFRLEIDEAAKHHTISWNALITTILTELDGGVRALGAAPAAGAFVRIAGMLWQRHASGWINTRLATAGAPAVVDDAEGRVDLLYRSPVNVLMHAFRDRGETTWTEESLETTIIDDPVALRGSDGNVVAAAIDTSYRPIVWRSSPSMSSPFDTQPRVVGTLALVDGPAIQLYARGVDGALYVFEESARGPRSLGVTVRGSPSVLRTSDGPRIYVREAATGALQEITQRSIRSLPALDRGLFTGSPSASIDGSSIRVYATTTMGGLATFVLSADVWSSKLLHWRMAGPPVSVGAEVFGFSRATLWRYDGVQIANLGRPDVTE